MKKDNSIPLVSVIMPTYNQAQFISEAVDSVLNQTYKNLEFIIIDNYSNDETEKIVSSYSANDLRIRYTKFSNNGVIAASRNLGIKMARGEFLAFIDSDDLWLPQKLEKQVSFLKNNKDVFLLYSRCSVLKDGIFMWMTPRKRDLGSGNIFIPLFLSNNFISCSSVMLRNELEENNFLFDTDKKLIAIEDYDLWLRIAKIKHIGYLDESLMIYRLHQGNISYGIKPYLLRYLRVANKHCHDVGKLLLIGKYLLFFLTLFVLIARRLRTPPWVQNIINRKQENKNKKIKILQFQSTALLGGVESLLYSLTTRMNKSRFDNEICFLYKKGPVSDYYLKKGFKITHLNFNYWNLPLVIYKVFKMFRKERYDIIYLCGLKVNLIGRIIGNLTGCKNIIGGLYSIYPCDRRNSLFLWLDKITLRFSKYYISNSRTAVRFLVSKGFPAKQFKIIHNGIDINLFGSKAANNYNNQHLKFNVNSIKVPIIVCVANLRPIKGHIFLIDALEIIRDKGKDFITILIGEGKIRKKLEKYVVQKKLESKILFLGLETDISNILAISDIFVLTSLWEGLPVSIMEAMASRLPAVATDVGGVSEVVVNNETGLLVPPQNSEAIAKAIFALLSDSCRAKNMGKMGRERIKQNFTVGKMVKQTEDLYEKLIGDRT